MSKKKKRRPAPRKVAGYIKFRAGLVFLVVLGLMCFLLIRIIVINQHNGEDYNKTILNQMAYDSRTIPAERGRILDRNGTSLAYNENRYNLILEPKNILLSEADTQATINALVECYGLDRAELEEKIEKNKDSYYVNLNHPVSEDERQKFLDYKEEYENSKKTQAAAEETDSAPEDETEADQGSGLTKAFQAVKAFFTDTEKKTTTKKKGRIVGVTFEINRKRVYPYKTLASTTIGFANSSGGVAGLEYQYDDLLSGTDGRKYGYLNQDSSVEIQTIEETDGYTLKTTLDAYIQKICEKIINKYEKKTGSNVTSIMVMNPNNGEIYAMAASRQYDLSNPTRLTDSYSEEELENMTDEEKSEILLNRWRNFCTSSSYEPGSTAKVFTVAAGMEENKISPDNTFVCDGVKAYGSTRIHCHKRSGHGSLNVTGALMASCNDALMQMGAMLQRDKFAEYEDLFNFGYKTGIDLPGETTGYAFSEEQLNVQELATSSFGQGITMSMIQIAAATASIINGGYYYQPHLVSEIKDSSGSTVKKFDPILMKQTVSSEISADIRSYMQASVQEGTSGTSKVQGYSSGGKTGTAEVNGVKENHWHSWMAAYGPYDAPVEEQYVVVVIVEAVNDWEWWAPYCTNIIFQGILANQNYDQAITELGFKYLIKARQRQE